MKRNILILIVWMFRLFGIGCTVLFYALLTAQGKTWWLDTLVVGCAVAAAWIAWILNHKLNKET
jgi:hypothetical protein